ncbi:MAG: hypothetical protein R3A49_04330 [Acidimicrobiia bacterium]
MAPRPSLESANALLTCLTDAAEGGAFVGFMHEIGSELDFSPTRVSRALRILVDAGRVEVAQRGHGRHPTRIDIIDTTPVEPADDAVAPLAERLLEHLHGLSEGGVVEQPLVEVARDLDVGAPSVSRALGQLVDSGRARVDRVGTRSHPTRIELAPDDKETALLGEIARLEEALAQARERLADLRRKPDRASSSAGPETGFRPSG